MHLNNQLLQNSEALQKLSAAGIKPVGFDRASVIEATKKAPTWVHFGAGNIFRAFLARAAQELIENGEATTGVIAAEGFDYEIINMSFKPYDDLFILVTLNSDSTADKSLIASITEALKANSDYEDFTRLREIFRTESLQMASFTITEKGYSLLNADKQTPTDILHDFENGAEKPRSYMGRITALVYERFLSGGAPLALVSMDNCSHNGDLLKGAVLTFAEKWEAVNLTRKGFIDYINTKISFPCTMIDKITPAPHKDVRKMLEGAGFSGMDIIITPKNSYTAPFVNAEAAEYLIIENDFPNGRPLLDKAKSSNIIFTDRETVDKAEKMKVCTCLNPLHTALAVFGCLLGFTKISEEMKDEDLKKLAQKIGYEEGLPVVTDPGIISPEKFLEEVINTRLPNPFLPDAPQRIATDTSQKLPIRFGETVKAYMKRDDLEVENLKLIPLVFAAWLRYLLGVDDNGKSMEISPDPLLLHLKSYLHHIKFGADNLDFRRHLKPVLEDEGIFGVNLYEAKLGEKVENMFAELIDGEGAVRRTLQKYNNEG